MAEVETQFTAFLQPLQQVGGIKLAMEHDVVAQLRNLTKFILT